MYELEKNNKNNKVKFVQICERMTFTSQYVAQEKTWEYWLLL